MGEAIRGGGLGLDPVGEGDFKRNVWMGGATKIKWGGGGKLNKFLVERAESPLRTGEV